MSYEETHNLQIFPSYEHREGRKAMADTIDAKLLKVEHVRLEELAAYDLLRFGSGIYAGKHHKKLIAVVEHVPQMDINVFVFFDVQRLY